MNLPWIIAGVVTALTAAVHTIAGHRAPLGEMLGGAFDEVSKRTMHAVWHMATVDLFLSATVLVAAGLWPDDVSSQLPALVGAHFGLYAVVFVAVALGSRLPRGLMKLPQWTLFLPIVGAIAAGYA